MILLETILRRWYAFAFLAIFFWAASAERGWKRAARFFAIAAFIEWTAEVVSTRTGFPFGRYDYLASTRSSEITVAGIPLFVPLTFCVAVWAARSLAQAGLRARSTGTLILAGAVVAAVLDLIIDPMTLRGRQWFLGWLYSFREGGGWFGVPWTNFGGWVLVSGVILWIDELFDVGRERVIEPVRGPTLAVVIAAFFMGLAVWTKNWAILAGQAGIVVVAGAAMASNLRTAYAESGLDEGSVDSS